MPIMIKLQKDNEVCYFTTDKITAMFEPDALNPLKNSHHVIMVLGCPPQMLSRQAYVNILNCWKADLADLAISDVITVNNISKIVPPDPFKRVS